MSCPEYMPAKYLKDIHLNPTKFPNQLYGWPFWKTNPIIKDVPAQIKALRKFEMREDDVIIAAFPKCGTHWVWEVVKMLRKGKADIESRVKAHMLEFQDIDHLTAMSDDPSPRTLNSHYPFCHLPQQIVEKKVKIIHLVRNPKDVLVSGWYHFSSMPHGKGKTLAEHVDKMLSNNMYNLNQLWYERQMQAWCSFYPEHPVLTVCYEDMKMTPLEMTQKIAQFLGLDVSSKFCQEVVDACSFDRMKQADKDRETPEHVNTGGLFNDFTPYRKGIIGDWKNHLTVAQNEAIDAYIENEVKDLNVNRLFRYQ